MLTATLILLAIFSGSAAGQTLSISPSPLNVSLYSSSSTSVNATISSVTYLYGYQYEILYDSSVFTPYSITEGPFLKTGGSTFCVVPNTSIQGRITKIACTRQGTGNVSGTGNLTKLVFNLSLSIIPPVTTQIRIVNSKLSNMNSQPIAHSVVNGTINIKACLAGETRACNSNIGECRSGMLTCNSTNQWPISTPSTCVGSVWSTSEVCDGKDNNCNGQSDENATGSGNLSRACSVTHYGICAVGNEICNGVQYAGCPLQQTEICYNGIDENCDGADSTCRGDITGGDDGGPDGCIDIEDLSLVGSKFGLRSSDSGWDARADIDTNGEIDIFDLVAVAKDFLVGCS